MQTLEVVEMMKTHPHPKKHLKKWQVLHLQIVSLPIPLYLKKTFNKVVYRIPLLAYKRFESTALEPLKQQGS